MLINPMLLKLVVHNVGPLARQDILALLLLPMPEAHESDQQSLVTVVERKLLLGDPTLVIGLIDVMCQCIDVCIRCAKDVVDIFVHCLTHSKALFKCLDWWQSHAPLSQGLNHMGELCFLLGCHKDRHVWQFFLSARFLLLACTLSAMTLLWHEFMLEEMGVRVSQTSLACGKTQEHD